MKRKCLLKVQVWVHYKTKDGTRYVLLLKTKKSRGGFWQPVTGCVESGETVDFAAFREAQEETCMGLAGQPKRTGYSFTFRGKRGLTREYVFEARPGKYDYSVRVSPHEHQAAKFVKPEEALGMLKFESNAEALRRLMNKWRKNPRLK
ncbi:MAG: hypothetical protein A2583_01295 [Bdellovibrionales bacterium RIFOXYD1_FULL_53_11]|nr:MAG: hypothetical protein A2583_01295 [Bdellovibrionales bacterium RIFOXYD1_FULL_53_11]